MSAVLFFIAAIGVITGAVGVVVLRDAFYSVLSLVVHLVSLAVLFLLLRAEFVAAVQVVVYAGAVMVLYVFVVAYIGGVDEPLGGERAAITKVAPLFALALLVEICLAVFGSGLSALDSRGAHGGHEQQQRRRLERHEEALEQQAADLARRAEAGADMRAA